MQLYSPSIIQKRQYSVLPKSVLYRMFCLLFTGFIIVFKQYLGLIKYNFLESRSSTHKLSLKRIQLGPVGSVKSFCDFQQFVHIQDIPFSKQRPNNFNDDQIDHTFREAGYSDLSACYLTMQMVD